MRRQVLSAVTALAATLALAQPAAAQRYNTYHDEHVANYQQCQQSRNNRTVGGAAIGALGGAVLGSQAGGRGHRSDGSILGAVVGAIAGGAIGRSTATAACNQQVQGSYDPYYGQSYNQYGGQPYAEDPYKDGDDLYGGPSQSGYSGRSQDCRMGQQILRDPYGREVRQNVMMCRGDDGQWYPQR
jgi:uncharacterized protein YcfJ